MLQRAILFSLIIVVGTAGEMCAARAMRELGEVKNFRPAALLRVFVRALKSPWMVLGLMMMTVSFIALLGMLTLENVSLVIPLTALSYVVGCIGGKFFLAETISWKRYAGVLLVCGGIVLVVLSRT
jgi:drug/metabolite transporter (DMT)-like permease